jgi:divalent metal cation (Fe/Co/Zn/Cd) transporter
MIEAVRDAAVARGRSLEYLTVVWNSLEGIIAVAFGLLAGSIALVGFGFDSVIEVSSGLILLWRLHMDRDASRREQIEARALKLVGVSFFVLSGYVAYDAVTSLIRREAPDASYPGIALAALSLVVMPALARAKRRVAVTITSRALAADARQTDICAYLSAILLAGLGLNAAVGWWWADPVAGLGMTPILIKEGIEALRGETCCDSCH